MKKFFFSRSIILLLILFSITCREPVGRSNDYWLSFTDSLTENQGYKDVKGKIVIPLGKYKFCYTDTFKHFAIVLKEDVGFIAIDRNEKMLYQVFVFDNGPDEVSENYFRIIQNNKIGFANSNTGKIIIQPIYSCAYPFNNGVAQVCFDCKVISNGEHSQWESNSWFYVNKDGNKVESLPLTQ